MDGSTFRGVRPRGAQSGACKVDGCSRKDLSAYNMCGRHALQVSRGQRTVGGALLLEIKNYDPGRYCQEPSCREPVRSNGLCESHKWRARSTRNGTGTCRGSTTVAPGIRIDSEGYVNVRVDTHYPELGRTGWARQHRVEMELHIGRALKKNEVVHHRDGDRQYNAIENLELLTIASHAPGHAVDVRSALDLLEDQVHIGMEHADSVLSRLSTLTERLSTVTSLSRNRR